MNYFTCVPKYLKIMSVSGLVFLDMFIRVFITYFRLICTYSYSAKGVPNNNRNWGSAGTHVQSHELFRPFLRTFHEFFNQS